MTKKPTELAHAELVDGLAQRYSQLPSAILDEPTTILKMLAILEEAKDD